MVWGHQTGQKHFMMSVGRTSKMPVFPTVSCGLKLQRRNTPIWISAESAFTVHLQEARVRQVPCFFIPNFTRLVSHRADATITEWIRFGGTNNGWAGLSVRNMHSVRMLTMPGD